MEKNGYETETMNHNFVKLNGWDILTVAVYFVLLIAIGICAMTRSNRGTVAGYFLAGRTMRWFSVGASLFVSNIGSEHFIGLAGSGAAIGFAVAAWELNAVAYLQMLGFLFVPVYITSRVVTMPEYLSKRFGGTRLRVTIAVLSLLLYIFTKVSVNLYAGALFIQQSLGWNIYLSMIGLILITALLTITGGLAAVIYTDTLQAILMVLGATILTALSFIKVGGYYAMKDKYMKAIPAETNTSLSLVNSDCGKPLNDSFIILREPTDPDVPWPGLILGQTWPSIWYWCTDQVIVQRALAAKSLSHVQGATILAGFTKILPLFIMVFPGLISRILYTDEVACVDPEICQRVCQSSSSCSNIALPRLVLGVMPTGARGLMMSVMIAALMSDLDSIFNSSSTLFTLDIWKRVIRPHAKVGELMIVGRIWILLMVGFSISWVPVLLELQGGQLFLYIQEVSGYLAPPICAIFVIGMFWTRCNEKGAFWGLLAGFTVGITRMFMVFAFQSQAGNCYTPDTRPDWYKLIIGKVHFMYFAFFIFVVTIIVAVIVSLLTEPLPKTQIKNTTWWTKISKKDSMLKIDESELMPTTSPEKTEQFESDKDIVSLAPSVMLLRRKILTWICGYDFEKKSALTSESQSKDKDRELPSIEQDPNAKLMLRTLLVISLIVMCFIFIFFSLT